jgi:outer membrane protein with beta-barrel domain
MRVSGLVITAAVAVGLSGTAFAQTTTTTTTTATTQTSTAPSTWGPAQNHWIAAGFVGSDFGGNTTVDNTFTFGGEIGYLWRGFVGAELLADFTPSFRLDNRLLADDPHLTTYMANAIVAVPIGAEAQVQPYLSGGLGGVSLHTSVFDLSQPLLANGEAPTVNGHSTRFGTNVGGGIMGFMGNIGFRGDIRYYRTGVNDTLNASAAVDQFTEQLLSDVNFWRADFGVAFRW